MSRLEQAKVAVRPSLKARALFSGPSGSGKTRTALIVAEVLAEGGTVLVIDTEKESAATYADDFTFDHLMWEPPFDPRDLATTLGDAGRKYDVVIVDSLSHFWRGEGGTLDIADGKFTGWKAARPAQDDLVAAILNCGAHFIGCSRSKVEHVQEVENGRHVVKKLGMAVIQDDTLEYELNVAAEIDMMHQVTISKSRTVAVPVGRSFKAGHAADLAVLYRDWLKGGEPPADARAVEGLVDRMNALDEAARRDCKAAFLAELGRPDHLRASQLADAELLVKAFETGATPPDSGGKDSTPDGSGVPDTADLGVGEPEPEGGGDALTNPDGPSTAAGVGAPPPDGELPLTDHQRKKIHAIAGELWEGPEVRDGILRVCFAIGHPYDSRTQITEPVATVLIETLERLKAGTHELHLPASKGGRWVIRAVPKSRRSKAA